MKEIYEPGECDDKCYTPEGMCPRAEFCERTRRGEFMATVVAVFFMLVIMALLSPGIIAFELADWVYRKIGRKGD